MRLFKASFLFTACAVLLTGCVANYEKTALKSWPLMAEGKPLDALPIYEKDVTDQRDELLRWMDEGILLRTAGDYKESQARFFKASKRIEQNGYLSLGEQAVSLVTNERMTTYQGEDFEKVLVHMYLALNFIELGDRDAALVEARRVNEILSVMVNDGKRPYELNAFARYLTGVLFEADRDNNNALVSYKQTVQILPKLPEEWMPINVDFVRQWQKLGMTDELDDYSNATAKKEGLESVKARDATVVLLFEAGKSPEKYSSKETHRKEGKGGTFVEVLVPVSYYKTRKFTVKAARLSDGQKSAKSQVLNDIETTAIQHLKDRMGRTIAKALLTAATKTGLAVGVGKATGSDTLGMIAGLILLSTSEADTRSWLLLPASLQVAKLNLSPGRHDKIEVEYLDSVGRVVRSENIGPLTLKPNEIRFIQRRSFE